MIDELLNLCDVASPEFKIAAPLLRHIEVLHGDLPGWTEISCIHPDPTHHPKMVSLWAECTDGKQLAANAVRAAKGNLQGYGLYIGITTRRDRKSSHERGLITDAQHISALWVDSDGGDLAELAAFSPEASIILSTGGGYHLYWLLEYAQTPTEVHRRTLRGLAQTMKADVKCGEFSRVLRAMGSHNTKQGRNNARCTIERWEPGWKHSLHSFAHLMEVEPAVVRSAEPAVSDDIPDWISQYMAAPPPVGERNATLYRIAATLKDIGWGEATTAATVAGFAGLNSREIETTVHSAYTKAARGQVVRGRNNIRQAARA